MAYNNLTGLILLDAFQASKQYRKRALCLRTRVEAVFPRGIQGKKAWEKSTN